jgi:hypothetical protein
MKTLLSTILLLCLASLAVAQRKAEFGLVVKAGTHAIPATQKPTNNLNQINLNRIVRHKAGHTYMFGCWFSRRLGNKFRFSWELLFRSSAVSGKERTELRLSNALFQSVVQEHAQESSISVPFKLHRLFKPDGKASFFVGAGLSRVFAAEIHTKIENRFNGALVSTPNIHVRMPLGNTFQIMYNLNAGFQVQIDPKTALGIEYNFEPATFYTYIPFGGGPPNSSHDCFCDYPSEELRVKMNSFSVSLRHNILD